jgi:diketogulonate reductase-like aldo/keto reductase
MHQVLEWCHKHGVLYTSYSTLGTQWQWRAGAGGGNPVMENPVIKELATRERVSPALLALAWVLEEGAAVIPRSSKAPHIRELARLLVGKAGIKLTQADMQRLRALDGSWEGHGDEL